MEEKTNEKITAKEKTEDEINILDYFLVLAKRKKLIITITLSIAIVTVLISLILPFIYRAEARILPIGQGSQGAALRLLNQFGGAEILGRSSLGITLQDIITILNSRTIYDRIIDRFGLMDSYKVDDKEKARKKLGSSVSAEAGSRLSRIIIISVRDRYPEIAADMANAFVEELIKRLQELAVTEASRRRLFFDEQLKQATEELVKSEEAMKEFQEKTGILNPDPLMPAIRVPAVATEYIRKLRELKYNEKLFEIMAKQYEIARIDEVKDSARIQVIDKAIPPEEKFRPQRRKMVMSATFIGFFLSVFVAFFLEYLEKQSVNKETRDKIEALKRYLPFKRKK